MRSSHIDLYLKGRDWSACERERPPWCVLYHYNSSCATVNLCRSVPCRVLWTRRDHILHIKGWPRSRDVLLYERAPEASRLEA